MARKATKVSAPVPTEQTDIEDAVAAASPAPASLFDRLVGFAKIADPAFADRHAKEKVNVFLLRLTKTISDLDEKVNLDEDVEAWFDKAADAANAKMPIDVPDGMAVDDAPVAKEAATAPAPVAEAPKKRSGKEALAEINAKRKAEKEAREAEAAKAPVEAAEAPKKGRGRPPKDATAASTPKAAKPAKEPKAPKEKKVKAPKEPRPEGSVIFVRKYMVTHPNADVEEIQAAAEKAGHIVKVSTVATTRTCMAISMRIVKELGHWKD